MLVTDSNVVGQVACTRLRDEREKMTVADLLRAVKRHWVLEIILFIVAVGVTSAYTFTATPMYAAKTQLMAKAVSDSSSANASTSSAASMVSSALGGVAQLAQSDAVLEPVVDNLGLHTDVSGLRGRVYAETVESSPFINLTVTYDNADDAVAILEQVTDQLNKQTAASVSQNIQLSVVQKPVRPSVPSSPNVTFNMAVGVTAGLILAVLAAVARELADNSIHTQNDVQASTDAPILAMIPKSPTVAGRTPAIIVKPRGHAAEEFRRLTTNLTFVRSNNSPHANLLVVTSSGPGEGKTTVSTNLAAAFVERGESVLLIDADARHPSVAKALGISNGVGLIQLLSGQVDAETAVQRYWKPEFQVLPVEDKSTSSAVILGSDAMKNMVEQACKHYDHVIIDTAPIQVSNDASVFAREGGTLLLVVSQGIGQKKALRETVHELKLAHVKISGVAFNRVAHEHSHKGNYYYYEESETKAKQAVTSPSESQPEGQSAPRRARRAANSTANAA